MTLNSLINNILFEEDTPNSFIDSIISRVLSKQINEPAFEGNIGDNGNFQNFINTRISLMKKRNEKLSYKQNNSITQINYKVPKDFINDAMIYFDSKYSNYKQFRKVILRYVTYYANELI